MCHAARAQISILGGQQMVAARPFGGLAYQAFGRISSLRSRTEFRLCSVLFFWLTADGCLVG